MSLGGRHIAVLALADLGRSPRTMYHALALRHAGARVSVVGYEGTALIPELENDAGVVAVRISPSEHRSARQGAFWWGAARDGATLTAELVRVLRRLDRPDGVLVQCPPAIPSLACIAALGALEKIPWLIDWHNFGLYRTAGRQSWLLLKSGAC